MLEGVDVRRTTQSELHERIACVPQDTALFERMQSIEGALSALAVASRRGETAPPPESPGMSPMVANEGGRVADRLHRSGSVALGSRPISSSK